MFGKDRREFERIRMEREAYRSASFLLADVIRTAPFESGSGALGSTDIGHFAMGFRPEIESGLREHGVNLLDDLLTEYCGLPQQVPPSSLQEKYGFSDTEVTRLDIVFRAIGWDVLIDDELERPPLGPELSD